MDVDIGSVVAGSCPQVCLLASSFAYRELMKLARERDEERKLKVEEARRKTELLLKAQEDVAEANRLKMVEREMRILGQLEAKKEAKKQEVQLQREAADKRIAEALEKYHELHIGTHCYASLYIAAIVFSPPLFLYNNEQFNYLSIDS